MIIYLHGFNSSPASGKAALLVEYCAGLGVPCAAPLLHHRPARAAAQIAELLKAKGEHLLAGSSMGGYYATWFCEKTPNARAVLINPAVRLADKLAECEGKEQTNYHTGEKYIFGAEHSEEFRALEIKKPAAPEKYLLLAQTGDEVLDYKEAVEFYAGAKQMIEEGGNHSYEGFERRLADIVEFAGAAADKAK